MSWHLSPDISCASSHKTEREKRLICEDISPGDLVWFEYVYSGCSLNQRYAVYIGKKPSKNLCVVNEAFLMLGDSMSTIVDKGVMAFVYPANLVRDLT